MRFDCASNLLFGNDECPNISNWIAVASQRASRSAQAFAETIVEVNDYSIWCCAYNDRIQIEGILMPAALKYLVAMPACALLAISAYAQIATDVHGMPASTIIENNDSPIFGVTISTGYSQWELIGVAHESGLDEVRGILGNAIVLQAYLDGSLHFPDGTILAELARKHSPLCEVDGPFFRERPPRRFKWARDLKNTSHPAAVASAGSSTASRGTRRSTEHASPATRYSSKGKTGFLHDTHHERQFQRLADILSRANSIQTAHR